MADYVGEGRFTSVPRGNDRNEEASRQEVILIPREVNLKVCISRYESILLVVLGPVSGTCTNARRRNIPGRCCANPKEGQY